MPHNPGQAAKGRLKNEQIKKGPPKRTQLRIAPPKRIAKRTRPPRAPRQPKQAPAQEQADPTREAQEAIKTAARLDQVLSATAPGVNGHGPASAQMPPAMDAGLVKSLKHQYKHALEAVHRQAVLTGSAKSRKQEVQLRRLFEAFTSALECGEKSKAESRAQEIRELTATLVDHHEHHDHPEKKELKKLVAARGKDQDVLAGSASLLGGSPELAQNAELVGACEACAKLLAQGQKNSVANQQALEQLLALLDKLPPDLPAEAAERAASIRRAATQEKDHVAKVQANVQKAVSGTGAIKFAETSKSGDGETTKAQNETLKKMLAEQAASSNVFAKLLEEIMGSTQELELVAGRGSCGLFDSFTEGTVDTAHFGILPAEPATVKDKKVGLTQGEILVHVLEERLYSRQRSKDDQEGFGECTGYNHAHNKCLAPGSYQNLYRRERGVASDTLQLTNGRTKDGTTGFQHLASDGSISTTPIEGINSPGFKPDPDRFEYDAEERDGYAFVMERFKKALEVKFRNGKLVNGQGKFDRSKLDPSATEDWVLWLMEQTGDKAKAGSIVEQIVAELGAKYEALYVSETKRVKAQTGKANDFLNGKKSRDLSPGSFSLRQRRQARGKGQINDAVAQYRTWQDRRATMSEAEKKEEDKKFPKISDTSRVNCAVTSLGAITGGTSTEVVHNYFDLSGCGTLKDKCGGLQGDDMWAFIEEGRVPEPIPNDDDHIREQLSGDAQLRGIRKVLLAEAAKRGPDYKVIQEGVNDHGGMLPPDKLLEKMAQYPDGTQFQLFVNGDMRHWVYAEMFEGQVVIEDYQMSSTEGKGVAPTAKVATQGQPPKGSGESMPDNPMSSLGGSFSEGMFLALAPIGDSEKIPPHATNPDWPEPGSETDTKLSAVVAELARSLTPADLANALERNSGVLEPGWCDAATVVKAIREAIAAFEELKKPRNLSDPPLDSASLYQKHKQAIVGIKAGNKQIERLLQAKALAKLRYAPQPTVAVPSGEALVIELAKAEEQAPNKFKAAKLIEAHELYKTEKDRLKNPDKWDASNSASARKILELFETAIDQIETQGIPDLKKGLLEFVEQLGLRGTIKRYEKRMKVEQSVPDAKTFLENFAQDKDRLAAVLGRDELSDEELRSALSKRSVVASARAGLADMKLSDEQRAKESAPLDAKDAELTDEKLLEKKKSDFPAKLDALQRALLRAQDAANALASAPGHGLNDMRAADGALKQLGIAIEAIEDTIVQTRLKSTIFARIEEELEAKRPAVKAKTVKPTVNFGDLSNLKKVEQVTQDRVKKILTDALAAWDADNEAVARALALLEQEINSDEKIGAIARGNLQVWFKKIAASAKPPEQPMATIPAPAEQGESTAPEAPLFEAPPPPLPKTGPAPGPKPPPFKPPGKK